MAMGNGVAIAKEILNERTLPDLGYNHCGAPRPCRASRLRRGLPPAQSAGQHGRGRQCALRLPDRRRLGRRGLHHGEPGDGRDHAVDGR